MTTTPALFPAYTPALFPAYTRHIADSAEILDASVTIDKTGSERWGEWIITTQYLQYTGGSWIDCYSRDEFFEKADALEHGRDKVEWLTNRASTLSEDEDDSDLAPLDYSDGGGM